MSEFSDVVSALAAEAEATLGSLMTSGTSTPGKMVGPDGETYSIIPRAANAFEIAAAGLEMQSHGYSDKTLMVFEMTKAQHPEEPFSWRRQKVTQLTNPPKECTIVSLNTDDPFFYIFVVSYRQPA